MSDQFKISAYRFDDPQEIELMFTQFKPSDKFPGTFSTKIIHEGVEKWWNLSQMVADNISKLGAEAGDKLIVTRKEGKKGSYTDVAMKGDITTQRQNLKEPPDDFFPPMEAYSQPGPSKNNSVDERIIRGMCFNNACAILSSTHPTVTTENVKAMTLKLHKEMNEWLRNG